MPAGDPAWTTLALLVEDKAQTSGNLPTDHAKATRSRIQRTCFTSSLVLPIPSRGPVFGQHLLSPRQSRLYTDTVPVHIIVSAASETGLKRESHLFMFKLYNFSGKHPFLLKSVLAFKTLVI